MSTECLTSTLSTAKSLHPEIKWDVESWADGSVSVLGIANGKSYARRSSARGALASIEMIVARLNILAGG